MAHLAGVSRHGADLHSARLCYAILDRADIRNARQRGANLVWARLEGAGLIGARLEKANLRQAYLEGASLGSARMWDDAQSHARTMIRFSPRKSAAIAAISRPPSRLATNVRWS